jgi:hypothetical protein
VSRRRCEISSDLLCGFLAKRITCLIYDAANACCSPALCLYKRWNGTASVRLLRMRGFLVLLAPRTLLSVPTSS